MCEETFMVEALKPLGPQRLDLSLCLQFDM